jgi:TolB-like protein/Tfp pilus assembly protein PilF
MRTAAASSRSVAVLNFRLLSRDTTDAYLAEGLADAITTRLSQVRRLDVASRTAARLGRRPSATYIVSGTMLRQNRRLVVNVELVRAGSDRNVWAQRYERPDSSVLDTERDIALAVATAMLPVVEPAERVALGGAPTGNAAAYDHLLRGDYSLAQRTFSSVTRAIQEYEAASRLDPTLAKAQARIALACAVWMDWEWDAAGRPAPETVLTKGVAAAARAIALDSMSSDAWMGQAYVGEFTHPRTYEGVEAAFRRAIALDPRNAEAHHQYGDWLAIVLRPDESRVQREAALAIDPARPVTLRNHGMAVGGAEGRRLLDSAIQLEPSYGPGYAGRAALRDSTDTTGIRADMQRQQDGITPETRVQESAVSAMLLLRLADTTGARALATATLRLLAPDGPLGLRTMALAQAFYASGDQATGMRLFARVRPRGAQMWFGVMGTGTDLSAIPPEMRPILEESKPPWIP